MMKQTHNFRAFFCGVLVTLLVVGMSAPAMAALAAKTIQVYTGVDVYVNDQKLEPKDANGNPVEVFVYNGTTYLPIRAIGNALGMAVQYDASSSSAYVGSHSGSTPAVWLANMDYFSGTEKIRTTASEQDNLGNTHYNCITRSFDRTYMLNGQYSRMAGVIYMDYEHRSEIYGCEVNVYGDGGLIYSYKFDYGTGGMKPVDFNIDLTGVLEMRVEFTAIGRNGKWENDHYSLGDVGLYT